MAPKFDTEIDPLFIDDDDVFRKDDLVDENKQFIKALLDKSNYNLSSNGDDDYIKTEIIDDGVPPFVPEETPDINLIPPADSGDQATDDKNYSDFVKTLETHQPDLLVEEPDDDRQNLIREDLFNKNLGDDIILPDPASIIKIEPDI